MVNFSHKQMKEEEKRRIMAVDAFNVVEKKIQELTTKLNEADRDKKSTKAALQGAERQVESQCKQLCQVEDQLFVAKRLITGLKKKLEKAKKAKDQAKQDGYNVGVAETEEALRVEVSKVCRKYCLQVWNEALNQVGIEASSIFRRAKNVYYPPAIRASGPPSSSSP